MQQKNQEEMKQINIAAAIEALLFVYGEPLEIKRIIKILKSDLKSQISSEFVNKSEKESEEIIKQFLEVLNQQYLSESRGLKLIFQDNKVQIATKPDFAFLLENFVKEEFKENLTPASLETLSLIAYLGPLTRSQIDYYRGVNSSFILRNLLIRGLIERFSDNKKANAYFYQISFDLLKYLGISKIEELPEYEKFKNIKINY